jgi:O-methyltransferase domain
MAKSIVTERARAGKGLVDIYPFKTLGEGLSSPDETVLVDVGGGQGQVLQDIRTHVPELGDKKMVLEDLLKTEEGRLPLENVDFVPYDFLTAEQPVNGARTYLLRHILHDCPALVKSKSKILIVEIILPPMNPPIFGALMDIQMMNYGGGGRKERQ